MSFNFETLSNGAILITPKVNGDQRGFFLETYKKSIFEKYNIGLFVQDNHSLSIKGVLRGIHFQNPKPQGKLIRCINGSIWDVAVDLRKDSPTFKKWIGVTLNSENNQMLWVPEGYGHAFLTLSDVAEINYKCTNEYDSTLDASILWNDKDINISWGINNPILSSKDEKAKTLKEHLSCKTNTLF